MADLSDAKLADIDFMLAHDRAWIELSPTAREELLFAVREVRRDRAARLSAEELLALHWVKRLAAYAHCEHGREVQLRAIAVLDRLLAHDGEQR